MGADARLEDKEGGGGMFESRVDEPKAPSALRGYRTVEDDDGDNERQSRLALTAEGLLVRALALLCSGRSRRNSRLEVEGLDVSSSDDSSWLRAFNRLLGGLGIQGAKNCTKLLVLRAFESELTVGESKVCELV